MSSQQRNRRDDIPRRDFGNDGISGIVSNDRALRAREISRPTEQQLTDAQGVRDSLLARLQDRRR